MMAKRSSRGRAWPRPLFLLLLFVLLAQPHTGRAQGPEGELLTGTAPAPLSGAGSVVFISQAVDATLQRGEDGQYRVAAESVIRLHNSNRRGGTTVTLGWPGWAGDNLRFDAAQLPAFSLRNNQGRLNSYTQEVTTSWQGSERQSNWLVTQTFIGADARERLFVDWQQPLGAGPLLTYSFGALPSGAWPGAVGSLRVTLALPDYASSEIIVSAVPTDYTFSGTELEWLLVEQEPTANPTVTFIAPHLWQEIEAARAALASEPVEANLRLASLYEQLAEAGVSEYGSEAVAALEAAHLAAPESPEPLRRLALLYQARVRQQPDNLALLEQAVQAAEAALEAGSDDEALRAGLVENLLALAEAWEAQEPAVALDFLNRAVRAGSAPEQLAAQRQRLAEQLAVQALAGQDLSVALTLAETYGLPGEEIPIPWLDGASLQIESAPGMRVLRLHVAGEPALLDEQLDTLAARLNEAGFTTEWDGQALTLTLEGDDAAWQQAGQSIAPALEPHPELDLLRSALSSPTIQHRTVQDLFESRYGYREQLALESRAATLAEELRQAAATQESAWEQALMNEAADRWQRLDESQTVQLVARFEVGPTVQRSWSLQPPTNELVEWRGEAARRENWLLAIGGGALLLLLLLALIWLPGRRQKQLPAS